MKKIIKKKTGKKKKNNLQGYKGYANEINRIHYRITRDCVKVKNNQKKKKKLKTN